MELISVIVPIYNVESYLPKCIESIINQKYKQLEILLIDDGSTDSSGQICDHYAKKDSRIRVVHKKNGGLSDARNAGLDISNGKYIVFVDSDDYINVNMIEKLYAFVLEFQLDVAFCDICYFNGTTETSEVKRKGNEIWSIDRFWNHFSSDMHAECVVAWNKLYNRSMFINSRFSKGKIHEDEIIISELMSSCSKIGYLPEPLYYYRQREGSITKSKYSFAHLDMVEGLFIQVQYLIDHEMNEYAQRILTKSVGHLVRAYVHLDKASPDELSRYKLFFGLFKKYYHKIFFHAPFYTKANLALMCIHPRLYMAVHGKGKESFYNI